MTGSFRWQLPVISGDVPKEQRVGLILTAAEAAAVVGVSERTVRSWLKSGRLSAGRAQRAGLSAWAIDADVLAALSGVTISRERLAEFELRDARTPRGVLARLSEVEAELRNLKLRLTSLETGKAGIPLVGPPATPQARQIALGVVDASLHVPVATPPSVSSQRVPGDFPTALRTRADAARWLVRHGIASETTPKTWKGWAEMNLSQRAVLDLAISRCDPSNWRVSWRLHRCGDATCVCVEMLS